MPKVPQIRSLHIFAISPEQESMGDEVGFLPCVCVARYVKSTQNNKFTISLQYLKENGKNEIDFLTADKLQWFVEIDFIILGVCGQAYAQISKKNKFDISLQSLKKEVSDEVDFFMQIA